MRRIVQEILENKVSTLPAATITNTLRKPGHRNGANIRHSEPAKDIWTFCAPSPQHRRSWIPSLAASEKMSFSQKGNILSKSFRDSLPRSGLKLIYAVLIRVARRWNALKFTFDEQAKSWRFAMILNTMLSKTNYHQNQQKTLCHQLTEFTETWDLTVHRLHSVLWLIF